MPDARAGGSTLVHVLLALVVVILAARALGAAFRWIHQPPVIGEIVAGILLGPSLLGRVAPAAHAALLPAAIAPYLAAIAQIGVILFMFVVGLELDPSALRGKVKTTLTIAHASIVAPLVLGIGFARWAYPRLSTRDVPFELFALFFGVSLSVTAFPVLARILADRGLQQTRVGVIALGAAAVGDVTAWCLLAIVVSLAKARMSSALVTIGLAALYVAAMLLVARPLIIGWLRRADPRGAPTKGAMATALIALLLSALATEAIGVHALFGAFVLGAIIPHGSRLARELGRRVEGLVVALLLPAFFAVSGMRTQLGLVSGAGSWAICAVIMLIASIGKLGGSALAGRAAGLPWREATAVGVLMNARGLMELIVLNVGLDLHVIAPPLFAMLVLMALVTTFATAPALHLLSRGKPYPAAAPGLGSVEA